jgi:shikimate dehydrogenase
VRAAVLGHPIAHSLSPVLHRAAYAELGLDWTYEALDVRTEQLPQVVAGLDRTWAGLSLTMPLKQAVIALLDHVEGLARLVGAVNTVLVQPGGARGTLVGANTDVHGVAAALREAGLDADDGPRGAVVLGAGATAASALAGLAHLRVTNPVVLARSVGRAGPALRAGHKMGLDATVATLTVDARTVATLAAADVVVSTLPPHAADDLAALLAAAGQPVRGVLLDCAYDPRPTALVAAWRAAGGRAVSGERMLLHQATEQVRLMTGQVAPIAAMDAALQAALGGNRA